MFGFLRPAPAVKRRPAEQIEPTYKQLRYRVFAGIFLGYAAYYLVRNNLALAMPDILKAHPRYTNAQLGTALTGLSVAYGASKFLMGSVSDRSNPRWFLPLGLLLSCAIMLACGTVKAVFDSLALTIVLQTMSRGGFKQTGHWHHNVEGGRQMQARLRRPGYQQVVQLLHERIPTDHGDVTVIGLPSGRPD